MSDLRKNLLECGITTIGFDLDNTLFDTDPYYVNIKDLVFNGFVSINFPEEERSEAKKRLNEVASLGYKHRHQHGLKPTLIREECILAISKSFPELVDEKLEKILDIYTKDFYDKSPNFLPGVAELLNVLSDSNAIQNMFGATDAQEDWSRIKAEYIVENTKLDKFPYFSTDLKFRKNPEWWSSIFSEMDEHPENILIVGDNYYADIYSSLLAGVKHAIWVNRYNKSLDEFGEYPLPKHAEVIEIKSIDEILNNAYA